MSDIAPFRVKDLLAALTLHTSGRSSYLLLSSLATPVMGLCSQILRLGFVLGIGGRAVDRHSTDQLNMAGKELRVRSATPAPTKPQILPLIKKESHRNTTFATFENIATNCCHLSPPAANLPISSRDHISQNLYCSHQLA